MPVVKLCPRCGNHATPHSRYCHAHHTLEMQRRTAKHKAAGYNSPHWQRLRGTALDAAGHQCTNCGNPNNLTVHLHPALAGNHQAATLQDCTVLCRTCHGALDAPRSHA